MRRAGVIWLFLAVLGTLSALSGMLLAAIALLGPGGAQVADQRASVVGMLLTGSGIITALVGWAANKQRLSRQQASPEQIDQAARSLALAVQEQWLEELSARGLSRSGSMPIRWESAPPSLMADPSTISPNSTVTFEGNSRHIPELTMEFLSLPHRRLVITGAGGSGKTTLAVQMLHQIIDTTDAAEVVPVLITAADWDLDRHPHTVDWLTAVLLRDYPAVTYQSRDAAAALVIGKRILPILDGLDEIADEQSTKIIKILNETWSGPLILTCRLVEYRRMVKAGDWLSAAVAITAKPLGPAEQTAALRRMLRPGDAPRWQAVLDRLQAGKARTLTEVASTPLGLWLVRSVYIDDPGQPGLPPRQLIDGTYRSARELRRDLLDRLIPAVVRARPPQHGRRPHSTASPTRPRRRHDPDDVRQWLTTVAEQQNFDRTPDWRWWHLPRHTFADSEIDAAAASGALLIAVLWVLAGVPAWLLLGTAGAVPIMISAVLLGLQAFKVVADRAMQPATPMHLHGRLRGQVLRLLLAVSVGLLSGALVGGFMGLVAGVRGSDIHGRDAIVLGLLVGVFGGGLWGLTTALLIFFHRDDLAEHAPTPWQSYRGDRAMSLAVAMATAIEIVLVIVATPAATGMGFLEASGASASARFSLGAGLSIVLAFLIAFNMIIGGMTAWPVYSISAFSCWRRGLLPAPWRVMPMLADCHRMELLRSVGRVYQFRHSDLQKHLLTGCLNRPGFGSGFVDKPRNHRSELA